MTDDGSILYDVQGVLTERTKAGQTRNVWSCRTAFGSSFNCYSNTVTWNKAQNSVFMSFPEREITPDKKTAFHVKFDTPGANDFYNKMIGNTFLIDDLYALNGGGPR